MLDEVTLEQGRRVFEDVLRKTTYAPAETIVIMGTLLGRTARSSVAPGACFRMGPLSG